MAVKPKQVRQVERLIRKMQKPIADAFREAISDAATDIDFAALVRALEARDINAAVALIAISPAALSALGEAVRNSYIAGGNLAASGAPRALSGVFRFDGRHPNAVIWAAQNVGDLIEGIQAESLDTVRKVIAEGIDQNIPPRDLARAITGRKVGRRRVGGIMGLNSEQADSIMRAHRILSDPDLIRGYFIKDRVTGRMKPRFKLSDRSFDKLIRDAIRDGTALSGRQLANVIEAHTSKALGYRGRVIAKDQAFTSIAAGRQEGFDQMLARPDVEDVTKRWQHNLSENFREDHVAMSGTVVSLNEPFVFADANLMHSHDSNASAGHTIGCRCTTIYRVVVPKR